MSGPVHQQVSGYDERCEVKDARSISESCPTHYRNREQGNRGAKDNDLGE
jgi:hypothetical protein